jgi:hypothetical protein
MFNQHETATVDLAKGAGVSRVSAATHLPYRCSASPFVSKRIRVEASSFHFVIRHSNFQIRIRIQAS